MIASIAMFAIRHCRPSLMVLVLLSATSTTVAAAESGTNACQQQLSASELPASGCNRASSLHVLDMGFDSHLDGEAAPAGHRWLIMNLRFDNWMPADLMFKLDYQEPLLVGSLVRQLYLLVDDRLVVRPQLPENTQDSFVLGWKGAQQRVRLAFAIPDGECASLSLSYHHDQYADIVIPLLGDMSDSSLMRQSAQQQDSNDVMSVGVHEASFHDSWRGEPAPPGMQWLVVDLRGQSEWQTDVDALALRPGAAVEEKAALQRVMEYVGASNMLQAVVDGQYSYLREQSLSTLSQTPAWLTHAWAGGTAVFAVPDEAEEVALAAYFGEFVAPGIDSISREPMRFPVSTGEPLETTLSSASVLATIADSPTPVSLHGIRTVNRFPGHAVEEGDVLLLLDLSMANTSAEGGMMRVTERFQLTSPGMSTVRPVGVYLPGPVEMPEPFLLPAGEQRRFHLLYRLPETSIDPDAGLVLEYSGVSVNEQVALPPDYIN